MKLKICGIKSKEEIDYINEIKVDYVGFVFSKSKRRIDKSTYLKLIENLDKSIKKVAVFKDENIDFVKEVIKKSKIDIIQFHGNEDVDYIKNFKGKKIWKALNGEDKQLKDNIKKYEPYVEKIIIDSKNPGEGKSFDWNVLKGLDNKKIIIAGGLKKENLRNLINFFKPYAIDLSSSVENLKGKDLKKLKGIKKELLIINKDNRIKIKLLELDEKNKKGIVTFIPLSYPSEDEMINYILQMEKESVDMVEIGFGGENPYMDGDVIKNAYKKLNENHVKIEDIFKVVKRIRKTSNIPLILMTYKSEIINKDKSFFRKLKNSELDGIIVPDMNYDELLKLVGKRLMVIKIVDGTAVKKEELEKINQEGFIYIISRKGKTGDGKINFQLLEKNIKDIKGLYKGKLFIGFGMGRRENREKALKFSDGVIIGTAVVSLIDKGEFFSKDWQ